MDLLDRFRGCLIGLAVADALGGRFEAQTPEALRSRFPNVETLMAYPDDELWYTDDTQMTIAVAEALIESDGIDEETLCARFVANYVPSRGYGRGARAVLDAMEEGRDYRQVAETKFPGGSYGNGAAMRVAPVGLFFHHDPDALWEAARLSALPTHVHPLGIEGAQLLALAVSLCINQEYLGCGGFYKRLREVRVSDEFHERMVRASMATSADDLAELGNGIEALESVATAIARFAMNTQSYEKAIGNVILLGGDTDTLAAMAGALSGAYLGLSRLPSRLVGLLESSPRGRDYLLELADQLHDAHQRRLVAPDNR